MVWLSLAGAFTELAILFMRRAETKQLITGEAAKATIKLLKDTRTRISNAQEAYNTTDFTDTDLLHPRKGRGRSD